VAAGEAIRLQPAQMQALGVATETLAAESGAWRGGLPAKVVVPNAQLRVVATPFPGLVTQLAVAPGMAVQKGQVLARVLAPQAWELQRDLRQAEAQALLGEQNLKRDEQLFAEGLIAEARLQASRSQAAQQRAGLRERQLALKAGGGVGDDGLVLRAPLDGVVLEQMAQVGQRLEAAAPLYRLGQLNPLWLEIQVPASQAAQLAPGTALRLREPAASGRVLQVGRLVDAASQSVPVRAEVRQGAAALSPGQAVEVELALPAVAASWRLPAAALVRHEGQTVVFVAAGEGQFRAQPVQVLEQGGDSVRVGGLSAGATVAVRGVSGLKAIWTGVGRE
jgi:RND family efflux transporter MFP subunit